MDLEEVKSMGITLKVFHCLAHCQGLSVDLQYCDETATLEDFRAAVEKACVDTTDDTIEESSNLDILVISYSRQVVGQTGSGHFSPIAAFDKESDSVLILDTARFKYGVHWVKLALAFEAMKPVDLDTGKSRGYALLSFPGAVDDFLSSTFMSCKSSSCTRCTNTQPMSLLFRSKMSQNPIRRDYKEFLSLQKETITWEQVVAYWTKENSDWLYIWKIIEPQLTPADDSNNLETFNQIKGLLKELTSAESAYSNSDHRPPNNDSRSQCLSSHHAMYIVYLASLDASLRREIVMNAQAKAPTMARERLLCEADLVASAIEISDQTSLNTDR
jgi:hypothetical protein